MSTHKQQPRLLTPNEKALLLEFKEAIHYSPRYSDDEYEYRHVSLPKGMMAVVPKDYLTESGAFRILMEEEWRGMGIIQSLGWYHYEIHIPEPHILLFKREKPQE